MSKDREYLYSIGVELTQDFCASNGIRIPVIQRLLPTDRLYHVGSCAYYRPSSGIAIMVEKCAQRGHGGRAWSWPGYTIDRTPYGVLQHELGHHVDHLRSEPAKSRDDIESLFSWNIQQESGEKPLTGYLGNYEVNRPAHSIMEWFAENFRLFVTNPDLCRQLRPRFHAALLRAGLKPFIGTDWRGTLNRHWAPARIQDMAEKKISEVTPTIGELPLTSSSP